MNKDGVANNIETFSHLYALNCVVALSNAGTTLMLNGAYKEAQDVFQDSLKGLKCFFGSRDNDVSNLYNEIKTLEMQVVAAGKCIAALAQTKPQVNFTEISLEDMTIPGVKDILQNTTLDDHFERPIRVVISDGSLETSQVELVSSIILYNFGLSKKYLSKQVIDDTIKTMLLESSRRIMSLSLASLRSQYFQCYHDKVHLGLIVAVSARVVVNLCNTTSILGDINEKNSYIATYLEIEQISEQLCIQYDLLWDNKTCSLCAPSA